MNHIIHLPAIFSALPLLGALAARRVSEGHPRLRVGLPKSPLFTPKNGRAIFSHVGASDMEKTSFALLCLGVVESLSTGALGATDAVRIFFHADNGLYVRKQVKKKATDELMSRGVQRPDLFDALPPEDAHREFQRELVVMRSLCVKLPDDRRQAA